MRIALVAGGLPFGGTTTFCAFLGQGLKELGVAVEVFSLTTGNPLQREFENDGVPVHVEDDKRQILEDRLRCCYERLRAFQPTAVFAVIDASAFEVLRYLPPGVLRVGMVHDTLSSAVNLIRVYRNYIDQTTVVAKILLQDVERCAPGIPATYLQHGVPMAATGRMRDSNPSDPLRLIFYGRFHQDSKRVRIFPEIVAALHRRGIPFRWTLHGSGVEEAYLRRSFEREVASGQIVFSAPVDYRTLPEIVRQHDIYILASAHEGGPLTLLESMALGLVPICGEIPCLIQEVIDTSNGFRVPFEDAEAYAEAIEILHRNRERLESMSQAARRTIQQNFSATAMARRYTEFVQRHSSGGAAVWPGDIQVAPMLEQNPWRYSAVGRIWRRVGKRMKAVRLAS